MITMQSETGGGRVVRVVENKLGTWSITIDGQVFGYGLDREAAFATADAMCHVPVPRLESQLEDGPQSEERAPLEVPCDLFDGDPEDLFWPTQWDEEVGDPAIPEMDWTQE